jgi:hypothetical protein
VVLGIAACRWDCLSLLSRVEDVVQGKRCHGAMTRPGMSLVILFEERLIWEVTVVAGLSVDALWIPCGCPVDDVNRMSLKTTSSRSSNHSILLFIASQLIKYTDKIPYKGGIVAAGPVAGWAGSEQRRVHLDGNSSRSYTVLYPSPSKTYPADEETKAPILASNPLALIGISSV